MVELYRKLLRELWVQLGHLQADAGLEDLLNALCAVRYWAHCSQDKTVLFNPMEVDAHDQRSCFPVEKDFPQDEWALNYGFRQGEGRSHGPVLRGDTINFKTVDGPCSLMTAWKKLVSPLSSLHREFRQGEGRSHGPVLRGDTINFKTIDGPCSLMTAWKKLVSPLSSLHREASNFLLHSRPH